MADMNKIRSIREKYTGPDGKLDVREDDPRFKEATGMVPCIKSACKQCGANGYVGTMTGICNACLIDLAERGHADVAADHIGAIDGAGAPPGMYVASKLKQCPTCGRFTLADGDCGECQDHHARVRFREKHRAGVSPDMQGAALTVAICALLATVFVAGLVVRDVFR